MKERCQICGQVAEMIWVRAHYQCAACGQVTVPCCNGETACPVEEIPARNEPLARTVRPLQSAASAGKGG